MGLGKKIIEVFQTVRVFEAPTLRKSNLEQEE